MFQKQQEDLKSEKLAMLEKEKEIAALKAELELERKRKRSPDVIPNPPGGGYGMDLAYFGIDSDEDTNIDIEITPTQPPSKKSRLNHGMARAVEGDPLRATPYTGSMFAAPVPVPAPSSAIVGDPHQATPYTGTIFAIPYNNLSVNTSAAAEDIDTTSQETPPHGPTMTFTVPSPSDGDSDYEGESYHEGSSMLQTTTPTRITAAPTQSAAINTTPRKSSPLMSNFSQAMAPPSHSTSAVPSAPAAPNVALDKARQTALKHQPQQPSRLRESSRLSTSTIATETADEGPVHAERSVLPNTQHTTMNTNVGDEDNEGIDRDGDHEEDDYEGDNDEAGSTENDDAEEVPYGGNLQEQGYEEEAELMSDSDSEDYQGYDFPKEMPHPAFDIMADGGAHPRLSWTKLSIEVTTPSTSSKTAI